LNYGCFIKNCEVLEVKVAMILDTHVLPILYFAGTKATFGESGRDLESQHTQPDPDGRREM
jgi:hypothetical protein